MEGKSHNCAHQPRLLGLHPVPSMEPWKVFNHDTIKSYFGKTTPASRNQQDRAMQAQETERIIQVKKKKNNSGGVAGKSSVSSVLALKE